MALGRKLGALLLLIGTPACADVENSPTLVGIVSTPATSAYTSIEADETGTGSKLTGPWRFSGAVTISGAATFSSTLHVVGAATFDSTLNVTGATVLGSTLYVAGAGTFASTLNVTGVATAPNFNATDAGGLQFGGSATKGIATEGTHLYLRAPNASGAIIAEQLFNNGPAQVYALNFVAQEAGSPQFGGAASYGTYTDGTHIISRAASGGNFYFQTASGASTVFQVNAAGHYSMGFVPFTSACGTGSAAAGTDVDGGVFVGAGATSCTVNFGVVRSFAPNCTVTSRNAATYSYTTAANAITITGASIASTSFDFHCGGV